MAKKVDIVKLEEIITRNVEIVTQEFDEHEDEIKAIKKVICPFYKGAPKCFGCPKDYETLLNCKMLYVERIGVRPMQKWEPSFDMPTKREAVRIEAPKMLCDTCYLADTCPEFKKFSECSIAWGGNMSSLSYKEQLDVLINLQESRIHIARAAELKDGGMPDGILSNEMDRLSVLMEQKKDADTSTFSMNITAKNGGEKEGGGILAKLFAPPKETLPEGEVIKMPTTKVIEQPEEAEVIESKQTDEPKEEEAPEPKKVKKQRRKK